MVQKNDPKKCFLVSYFYEKKTIHQVVQPFSWPLKIPKDWRSRLQPLISGHVNSPAQKGVMIAELTGYFPGNSAIMAPFWAGEFTWPEIKGCKRDQPNVCNRILFWGVVPLIFPNVPSGEPQSSQTESSRVPQLRWILGSPKVVETASILTLRKCLAKSTT